jgi:hypothetical protein
VDEGMTNVVLEIHLLDLYDPSPCEPSPVDEFTPIGTIRNTLEYPYFLDRNRKDLEFVIDSNYGTVPRGHFYTADRLVMVYAESLVERHKYTYVHAIPCSVLLGFATMPPSKRKGPVRWEKWAPKRTRLIERRNAEDFQYSIEGMRLLLAPVSLLEADEDLMNPSSEILRSFEIWDFHQGTKKDSSICTSASLMRHDGVRSIKTSLPYRQKQYRTSDHGMDAETIMLGENGIIWVSLPFCIPLDSR